MIINKMNKLISITTQIIIHHLSYKIILNNNLINIIILISYMILSIINQIINIIIIKININQNN